MELLSQAPQQYVVAASCPWMGAWLCLMMQPSHIPIDINMLLEVKARLKVLRLIHKYMKLRTWISTCVFHRKTGSGCGCWVTDIIKETRESVHIYLNQK